MSIKRSVLLLILALGSIAVPRAEQCALLLTGAGTCGSAAAGFTFGYTSIGADEVGITNPVGSKFTATGTGTVTEIQVYISNTGTPLAPIRAAIYANAAGSPGALLAESSEVVQTQNAWNVMPISLAITNGTVYWLMAWGDAVGKYTTPGDVADQMAYQTGQTYPTWPNPFVKDAFLDRKLSIYAVVP